MARSRSEARRRRGNSDALLKSPTGIPGLDQITEGGFPSGRPTLICGSAGCGKTLMSMEFLVNGAMKYNEPGVYFAFEETPKELAENVRSLGFDLNDLERKKKLYLEHVRVDVGDMEETGQYDLEALFIRLGLAIDTIGAKRVVLDTLETLFGGLENQAILRAELQRLFRWLKDREVTAVITGERGDGTLTRQGLEEYVSDCVIVLDHRVVDQISTRRLRVVKYRGSTHGTNEYPFLIDERGIEVLPVTSLRLEHHASSERISTGIQELDAMLGGGLYRGSTVLISGTAGTGKTSLSGHLAHASANAGERCLYFAFEESPAQIMRNMRSIGIDLEPLVKKDLLRFVASRPALHGLESHLVTLHKHVRSFEPQLVIIDPISDMTAVGSERDAKTMVTRLIDFLKTQQITAVLTNLHRGDEALERTDIGISSIVDTWMLLRDIESDGERNRGMYILKSRGMAHSNQIREFLLTSNGIHLREPYIGPGGVLTGSARLRQEARDRDASAIRKQEADARRRVLERKRSTVAAQIESLQAEYDMIAEEVRTTVGEADEIEQRDRLDRERLATSHKVSQEASSATPNGRSRTSKKARSR